MAMVAQRSRTTWDASCCPCGHEGAASCRFLASLRQKMAGTASSAGAADGVLAAPTPPALAA